MGLKSLLDDARGFNFLNLTLVAGLFWFGSLIRIAENSIEHQQIQKFLHNPDSNFLIEYEEPPKSGLPPIFYGTGAIVFVGEMYSFMKEKRQ